MDKSIYQASLRRVKVRPGNLGWFLCWAVVFADLGTSVYYTPGILFPTLGVHSGIFVSMTFVVFVLLAIKYAEITWRFPEGGGVVNVSARALHPFMGLVGGLFILVDYYLTAALSVISGVIYLGVVFRFLSPLPVVEVVALGALIGMGVLNWLGIRDSARTSALFAILAGVGQFLVVIATVWVIGWVGIQHSWHTTWSGSGPRLTPLFVIQGYAGAFLAFSGLETIAQLAPAMREPRQQIAKWAMGAAVLSMALTSPLLTIWSTTLLNPSSGLDPNQLVSILGIRVGGLLLGDYVAVSGALLLIFASNTAIIGAYHVFLSLARMSFLPRILERRNRWRNTPQWAIMCAVAVPVVVIVVSSANVGLLGDLYAFGLLGAFVLTCLSLDIIRWHEYASGWSWTNRVLFGLGVLTTLLVALAWTTNLVNKWEATAFGGGLTIIGLGIGLITYAYHRPVLFPFLHRPNVKITPIAMARRMPRAEVLAVLPHDPDAQEPVVRTAIQAAKHRPLVFLYWGEAALSQPPELLEVADPYLHDKKAQLAFSQADRLARPSIRDRRYVYVPGSLKREMIGDVWRSVRPKETVLVAEDQDVMPVVALDRIRRTNVDGLSVLHLISQSPN